MSRDTSLWVPVHVGLWQHRRFLRLARLLGSRKEAAATLLLLWHATLTQAPDGVLDGWTLYDLALACELEDATPLLSAGWVEDAGGVLHVHDWQSYAGKLEESRESNRVRQARFRAKSRVSNGDVTVTVTNVTCEREKETESPSETPGSGSPLEGAPVAESGAPPTFTDEQRARMQAELRRRLAKPRGEA